MDMIILAIIGLIILFVVWYVLAAIKIAREWERMPLLRLGKFKAMKGPGLFFAWPIFDKVPVIVDLRTIPVDVTP
jgi:regulator of protease activity HflC (stomatin/prohibitin superfamily)